MHIFKGIWLPTVKNWVQVKVWECNSVILRRCSWQWGLLHIHLRFLLKRHFGVIRIQLRYKHLQLEKSQTTNVPRAFVANVTDDREELTHFISMTENNLPVMYMRSGMVRMRTKGSAREKGLIFTAHRTARHPSWIRVYKYIRNVVTCAKDTRRKWDKDL